MSGDHAWVTAIPAATDRRARLITFARRLRRRHLRAGARSSAAAWALVLAVPAIAALWWSLGLWVPVAVVFVLGALVGCARGAWIARTIPAARLLASSAATPGDGAADPLRLERVGSDLATWLEHDRRTGSSPVMTDWLADDLDADLRALPAAVVAAADPGRKLGRLRWLLPIVLLLLILWLLSLWWQPPWPGVVGGNPDEPGASPAPIPAIGILPVLGPDGEGGERQRPGRPEPEPGSSRPETPEPDEPEPDEPEPEAPQGPEEPLAPLLELPPQHLFLIPEFLGDGPTERVRVPVAEVPEGAAGASASAGQGGGGAAIAPPEPQAETFERAAERAQQARHVPDDERPIVRRFFELLREAAR